MTPAPYKGDVLQDSAHTESASHENHPGRRVKRRLAADTPNSIGDRPDAKRLRSVDDAAHQSEGKDGQAGLASAGSDEDVIIKRRQAHEFVKMAMKAVTSAKDDSGRQMSTEFRHLPDKTLFVDYYEVIRFPVSLDTIRAKSGQFDKFIKQHDKTKDAEAKKALMQQEYEGYADWKAAEHDFDMMWRNAKRYNVKGAQIYEDAQRLHKLTKTLSEEFARKLSGDETHDNDVPQSSNGSAARIPTTVYKQVKQGMKLIDATKSLEGDRSATEFFHELPDRKEYADYYQFIQNPISLAEIDTKMQQRAYVDIDQWAQDVTLMCDNAMQYNIEGSMVYQDAEAIKNELERIMQTYQEPLREDVTDQTASPAASTPVPGSSSGPKIRLNLGGIKEARPPAQTVTRPPKEKIIRIKRPALPEKVVSKEIVASLPQYGEAEKTTWAATLNTKQTKELMQLMKEVDDQKPLANSGNTAGNGVAPDLRSETDRRQPSGPLAVDSTLPVPAENNGTASIPSHQSSQVPAKESPPPTSAAKSPGLLQPKAAPAQASLPSPSASAAPSTVPPPSPSNIPSVLQPTLPPVASTSTRNPSRPTSSSLYASISIPVPIPLPQPQPISKIFTPKRPPHHLPLIRYFNFVYDLVALQPDTPFRAEWQNTIKLRNMRGITSHIVAINRTTRNIEITAFLEEGYYNLNPLCLNSRAEPVGHSNGGPIINTLSYAPLPELSLECNGKTPKGELVHSGGDVLQRPVAHKWSFSVDPAIVNFVIEVHVRRPAEQTEGGRQEVKETCMIFVNRQ